MTTLATNEKKMDDKNKDYNEQQQFFVTFPQVLRPELGQRIMFVRQHSFTTQQEPNENNNKWNGVWAEATLDTSEIASSQEGDSDSNNSTDPHSSTSYKGAPYHHGHLMDIILGISVTIWAIMCTFGMELAALLVWMVAVMFYRASVMFAGWRIGLDGLFMFLFWILKMIDIILLFLSAGITELLAGIGWFLTTLFGGFALGAEWHQYIRKLSHLTRWAFRGLHENWEPERTLPCFEQTPITDSASAMTVDRHDTEAPKKNYEDEFIFVEAKPIPPFDHKN